MKGLRICALRCAKLINYLALIIHRKWQKLHFQIFLKVHLLFLNDIALHTYEAWNYMKNVNCNVFCHRAKKNYSTLQILI